MAEAADTTKEQAPAKETPAEPRPPVTPDDSARKEAHALRQVLQAHGIEHKLDMDKVKALEIDGDAVKGDYGYRAPKIQAPPPAQDPPAGDGTLKFEDVGQMTVDAINKNWDQVKPALASRREARRIKW